ncbi:MAG: hypothetical protein K2K81_01610 [Muribaculaceae bacterium]|nr:hypothetical protein [Muribaculaceae bacterium]
MAKTKSHTYFIRWICLTIGLSRLHRNNENVDRTLVGVSMSGLVLLGDQEPKSKVKAFSSVGTDTQEILSLLKAVGIEVEFQSVPGNHYSDPIPRLDKAFTALY